MLDDALVQLRRVPATEVNKRTFITETLRDASKGIVLMVRFEPDLFSCAGNDEIAVAWQQFIVKTDGGSAEAPNGDVVDRGVNNHAYA